MEEVVQEAAQPPKKLLSKEERSKIMREAATRRWQKAKRAKAAKAVRVAKPAPAPKPAPKALQGRKRPTGSATPREFSSALKAAEKQLAKALLDRAEHAAAYNMHAAAYKMLEAQIPSLQNLVNVLKNPLGALPPAAMYPGYVQFAAPVPPSLEQIVGDEPIPYQNPPRRSAPPPPPEVPMVPVPQQLHPANSMGRAGGGAVGNVDLGTEEDEDQFLRDSAVAGGTWH